MKLLLKETPAKNSEKTSHFPAKTKRKNLEFCWKKEFSNNPKKFLISKKNEKKILNPNWDDKEIDWNEETRIHVEEIFENHAKSKRFEKENLLFP